MSDLTAVKEEVRTWLQENWDDSLSLVEWRNRLADSGWGVPDWPRQWYGRDLSVAILPEIEDEFAEILN